MDGDLISGFTYGLAHMLGGVHFHRILLSSLSFMIGASVFVQGVGGYSKDSRRWWKATAMFRFVLAFAGRRTRTSGVTYPYMVGAYSHLIQLFSRYENTV